MRVIYHILLKPAPEGLASYDYLFYASKSKPSWEDDPRFTKLDAVNVKHELYDREKNEIKVYDVSVNNPNCVKLYENSQYKKDMIQIERKSKGYYSFIYQTLSRGNFN